MNFYRLLSPDFALGKALVHGRALAQLPLFLLRRPSRHTVGLTGPILKLQPRYIMVSTPRLVNLYHRVQEDEALLGLAERHSGKSGVEKSENGAYNGCRPASGGRGSFHMGNLG